MKIICFCLLALFVLGCGKASKGTSDSQKQKYTPLSLEESKKLMTPTVYAIGIFNLETMTCTANKKIRDISGKLLFMVCKEVYASCQMQGSCVVKQGGKTVLLGVDDVIDGERRFNPKADPQCPYGTGSSRDQVRGYKTMCLDPYYSVAADLKIYNLGDVIYVPSAIGSVLPNGSIHDGYFIVRDSGGAIKGYGRFDFFLGVTSSIANSSLRQIGFGDKNTNVPYYVVTGPEAENFLEKRNFPGLPDKK